MHAHRLLMEPEYTGSSGPVIEFRDHMEQELDLCFASLLNPLMMNKKHGGGGGGGGAGARAFTLDDIEPILELPSDDAAMSTHNHATHRSALKR